LVQQREKYQQEAGDLFPPPTTTTLLSKIILKIDHLQHQQQPQHVLLDHSGPASQFPRAIEQKQRLNPCLFVNSMGLNALFEKL